MSDPGKSAALATTPLTPAEVGELWDFVHGDIMIGGIRELMRASLGLCPRHTWGYGVVEVELWIYGTGPRGGHQPFDVCVLYTDLLAHVVKLLRRHHSGRTPLTKTLRRRGTCRICDQLGTAMEGKPARPSFAGADAESLATEARLLAYTKDWLGETEQIWLPRTCPDCRAVARAADQVEEPVGGAGIRCLTHLTQLAEADESVTKLIDYLDDLMGRLDVLGNSMRQGAELPTTEQNAAWIEALGWFAGWDLPLQLLSQLRKPNQG